MFSFCFSCGPLSGGFWNAGVCRNLSLLQLRPSSSSYCRGTEGSLGSTISIPPELAASSPKAHPQASRSSAEHGDSCSTVSSLHRLISCGFIIIRRKLVDKMGKDESDPVLHGGPPAVGHCRLLPSSLLSSTTDPPRRSGPDLLPANCLIGTRDEAQRPAARSCCRIPPRIGRSHRSHQI